MLDSLLSPLNDWHVQNRAKMVSFAGMMLPVQYDAGIKAEHLHTRKHASLFDISHMVWMRLHAGDSITPVMETVQKIFPIDLSKFSEGSVKYSFLLNTSGGIFDDVMLSHAGNALWIVGNGARRDEDPEYLRSLLQENPEVQLEVIPNHALLALQGPQAVDALSALIPNVTELSFMQMRQYRWRQYPIRVFRQGYSGEDGFELIIAAEAATAFADALCQHSFVMPAGLGARDSLRLEAGLPLWGNDIDVQTTPIEAGLDFAIAKARREAPDFIGAETILQQLESSPQRRLCGVKFLGRQPARGEVKFYSSPDPQNPNIGTLTSGGVSPSLNVPIALAYLEAPYQTTGSTVYAEVRGKMLEAEVISLPFVPHQYVRKSTHRNEEKS